MEHAANFSFTATIVRSGGTSGLSGEFVAPDIEQLSVSAPNGSHNETLFVGSKAFVRSTSGQWVDAIGNPSRPTDPRATFSSLLNANFAAKRNGTFDCVLSPGAAAALLRVQREAVRCSITVSGPTVTTVRLASSSVRVAIVYSAVGTSPPITHP
jgi:hypothetical protein